ncbi:unnamed protein product [Staurois parvus]|uniref:Uncharacterized protein n=1 Tax=Staurois parvus TaxID=386267 RepID=A0ABN9HK46_9NEOB|nr:unnamed protein product [Staurois parvus]
MKCPPGTFFIGFFEFGQGHRGPMISYCPGGPMSCQSAPGWRLLALLSGGDLEVHFL